MKDVQQAVVSRKRSEMSNLLNELLNLESQKKYSIVLNGIGCFIF